MAYKIQEIFYSVQGEGHHSGKPAIFLRFMHCNFWTGKEEDRASAICQFCDTNFIEPNQRMHGGKYPDAQRLVTQALNLWPKASEVKPFIILTGGEPMLQVDESLIDTFHAAGAYLAIETNGSLKVPSNIDWICVSPKAWPIKQTQGDELKLVYPQLTLLPEQFADMAFQHFFLQPMDGLEKQKKHPQNSRVLSKASSMVAKFATAENLGNQIAE
jgi:7-carboxy-7-deazaguanine synthase